MMASGQVRAARAGGWQFIASLVTFAAGVVLIISTADPAYATAEQTAADRLGVSVADLPAAELARLNAEHAPLGAGTVPVALLLNLGMLLFATAVATTVWTATGESRRQRLLAGGATALALAAPLGWMVYLLLNATISSGAVPPRTVLDVYDSYAMPAMAVSATGGALALICLVVLLRGEGLVRWTGRVVLVLAGLAAIGAAAFGVPPVVPSLLGAVLGVVLVRTRSDGAVGRTTGSPVAAPAVG